MFSSQNSQVSSAANYIEECFSTTLYTGNGSTQTITNGIDLAGKGGLVWQKSRTSGFAYTSHILHSPNVTSGTNQLLLDSATTAGAGVTSGAYTYLSTGFSINGGFNDFGNASGQNYTSWTFRKQPKFFDIVTYTGTGSATTIAHNLGSVPGCIIVKCTSTTSDWITYHRSVGNTQVLKLNTTAAAGTDATAWNNTTPTSTVFSVGTGPTNNAGETYVAYIYANDAGGFGLTGTDNVISCGTYTGTGTAGLVVTLGYEPQWVLIKKTSSFGDWWLVDNMRGMPVGSANAYLYPNSSAAEATATVISPTATGFTVDAVSAALNGTGATYIYIAIRRGPMKVPTSGTSVYATSTSDTVNNPEYISNFPVDMEISTNVTYGGNRNTSSRLLQGTFLFTNSTNAESAGSQYDFSYMNGWATNAVHDSAYRSWMWRRAPSFFDEVCYTGDGAATRTLSHNLAVAPEWIILRKRNSSGYWYTYFNFGSTSCAIAQLEATGAASTSDYSGIFSKMGGAPTSTSFFVTNPAFGETNLSGTNYIAYLFATCAGVSKCTAFTGTGTLQTINCGFTSGSRFVLIKRTDAAGDWYVWDSARGLSSSTDPYLLLNSTAAEVTSTNWVDTTATGFQVTAASGNNVNINGASYIALAIA